MTTASSASESRELSLVGKVELKIALVSSETVLQALLGTYLTPLLLKLASEHENVRNKVLSLCQHIESRIQPASVQLPVADLLKQLQNQTHPLIRHFDVLFIHHGLPRLPLALRLELLAPILHDISKRDVQTAAFLFKFFLQVLPDLKIPPRESKEDASLRQAFGMSEEDGAFLATRIGHLLLFDKGRLSHGCCAGLTKPQCSFLEQYGRSDGWNPDALGGLNLAETKIHAVRFCTSGALTDVQRFLPALFASADSHYRIAEMGVDMLKRAEPAVSYEDPDLVNILYRLCLGESSSDGALPAKIPLQIKVLSLLCKSIRAASQVSLASQFIHRVLIRESTAGMESAKLQSQTFSFINWISRSGDADALHSTAPDLVGQLRSCIEDQGWLQARTEEPPDPYKARCRASAYDSIGMLASTALLVEPNLDLLRWLLTSLNEDSTGPEVTLSIEHALSAILPKFDVKSGPEIQSALASLLLHYVELGRSTRYVAVRLANRCLPFDSVDARLIDVLALARDSSGRSEVTEEAHKGLDPHWYQTWHPEHHGLPSLSPLMQRLFENRDMWDLKSVPKFKAFLSALSFCHSILLHHALEACSLAPKIDSEWKQNLEKSLAAADNQRPALAKHLRQDIPPETLTLYLQTCLRGLVEGSEPSRCGRFLLEVCALLPAEKYAFLAASLPELKKAIGASDRQTREDAAHLFGLIASIQPSEELLLRDWQSAIGMEVLEVHGLILSLAYYVSRCRLRKTTPKTDLACLERTIAAILTHSQDNLLRDGACSALSELAVFAPLLPQLSPAETLGGLELLPQLFEAAKNKNEKAIAAIGHVAMNTDPGASVDVLCGLDEIRQPEVHLVVGEALSCIAAGWSTSALAPRLDILEIEPQPSFDPDKLEKLLDRILQDCATTKPSRRQAASLWLLCLVQFCGHLAPVQQRLSQCQVVFKRLMSDRNSLNQETAARGLSLVYEKGSKSLQTELVKDLVVSFTGSTTSMKVSGETELFDAGALPTGDGSISTYKDIMSLAAEVGDSSLVYRFMSLASSDALWSSRAAFGRFGLGSLLTKASDEYMTENPRFYAALYRYRFDPNLNVRTAMNGIWTALVKRPNHTISVHLESILQDLCKNILAKEWRTRQASCAAMADLLPGQEGYEHHISQIWSLTFKVCDDIKESVRTAAMSLARVLVGILTRSLQAGKSSEGVLEQILPFLLGPQGLECGAAEVQDFSRKTILQIIKKTHSRALRPFVPDLVCRLLGLLSSIEPEMINYVHMNAETFGVTKQQLDDARLKNIRGSSMLEAIERCLDYLDADLMPQFSSQLETALKTNIGLPSRVGGSRVLVSLATRQSFIFQSYADRFLILARRSVDDRSSTVSSAYAVACGYLFRVASTTAQAQLIQESQLMYFGSEEDRSRFTAGDILQAVAKYATDHFHAFAAQIVPLLIVAKNDVDEPVRQIFRETWNEHVGGSRTTLLYLSEILTLLHQHLDSPKWTIKHAAAYAAGELVSSMPDGASDAGTTALWPVLDRALKIKTWPGKERLLPALVRYAQLTIVGTSVQEYEKAPAASIASAGPIVPKAESHKPGLQVPADAAASIGSATPRADPLKPGSPISAESTAVPASSMPKAESQEPGVGTAAAARRTDTSRVEEQIFTIALREAKRNNESYRVHALACLGELVLVLDDLDLFPRTCTLIEELTSDLSEPSRSGRDILTAATKALIKAVNPKVLEAEDLTRALEQTGTLVAQIEEKMKDSRDFYLALFETMQGLFVRMKGREGSATRDVVLERYLDLVQTMSRHPEYIRIRAAEALGGLGSVSSAVFQGRIQETAAALQGEERSVDVQALLRQV